MIGTNICRILSSYTTMLIRSPLQHHLSCQLTVYIPGCQGWLRPTGIRLTGFQGFIHSGARLTRGYNLQRSVLHRHRHKHRHRHRQAASRQAQAEAGRQAGRHRQRHRQAGKQAGTGTGIATGTGRKAGRQVTLSNGLGMVRNTIPGNQRTVLHMPMTPSGNIGHVAHPGKMVPRG